MDLHSHCEVDAHRSPLAAIVFSSNGMYIATASEQGTIIRVHLVSDATKSYSFRRGTLQSAIFSLSFSPSMELPDSLVVTSSSGSVHNFCLGHPINQRGRRSISFIGSFLRDSVGEALDPAYHHVVHNAVPAGVKSYAVVRNISKVTNTSVSESVAFRTIISIITYAGYFLEYSFTVNHQNESSWVLEREFNLLTVSSGEVDASSRMVPWDRTS